MAYPISCAGDQDIISRNVHIRNALLVPVIQTFLTKERSLITFHWLFTFPQGSFTGPGLTSMSPES